MICIDCQLCTFTLLLLDAYNFSEIPLHSDWEWRLPTNNMKAHSGNKTARNFKGGDVRHSHQWCGSLPGRPAKPSRGRRVCRLSWRAKLRSRHHEAAPAPVGCFPGGGCRSPAPQESCEPGFHARILLEPLQTTNTRTELCSRRRFEDMHVQFWCC